jgi:hypothetical protein
MATTPSRCFHASIAAARASLPAFVPLGVGWGRNISYVFAGQTTLADELVLGNCIYYLTSGRPFRVCESAAVAFPEVLRPSVKTDQDRQVREVVCASVQK